MDEFYKHIENSLIEVVTPQDIKNEYLKSLDNLYPDIKSMKNKDALEHYRILSAREPSIESFDESQLRDRFTQETSSRKPVHKLYKYHLRLMDFDDWFEHFHKPELTCTLTPKDIKIAGIIKEYCKGVMICLSPKENYYPSIQAFLDKVAGTKCKQIKSAKYYFEINTKSGERMHCHMYAKLKPGAKKGNLRSYFQKRYPYMYISKDATNSALVHKADITYGWDEYLTGLKSSKAKQSLKSLDFEWREKNGIPHILNL